MVQPLEEGTCIGAYRIEAVLGHGGFGIAYLAYDTTLECRVVIKEANPACDCVRDAKTGQLRALHGSDAAAFDLASSTLLQEARRMAALQHPGIIPVREVFTSSGSVFLVMPYLPGGSLAQRTDEEHKPAEVTAWLRALLSALAYIHGKGLLHRDIKPENILFDESGHPVLIDMGSMRVADARTTLDGGFTLDYAAPEVLTTGLAEPGPSADLFSLAATMRELVCGIAPPSALARAVEDNLRPLTDNAERCKRWGRAFLQAIDINLSLSPADRMPDAAAWLAALEKEELPRPAKPARQSASRLPWVATALSLAALLALAAYQIYCSTRASSVSATAPVAASESRSYDELREAALATLKLDEYGARMDAAVKDIRALCDKQLQYIKTALCQILC